MNDHSKAIKEYILPDSRFKTFLTQDENYETINAKIVKAQKVKINLSNLIGGSPALVVGAAMQLTHLQKENEELKQKVTTLIL